MPPQEFIHYQDGNITITNTRAVLGSKMYAMANITSVSAGVIPANRMPGVLISIVGALIAACTGCPALGLLGSSDSNTVGSVLVCGSVALVGLLVMAGGIVLAIMAKPKYTVRIGSASGEANALVSEDQAYIKKIVIAMNEAIVNRG